MPGIQTVVEVYIVGVTKEDVAHTAYALTHNLMWKTGINQGNQAYIAYGSSRPQSVACNDLHYTINSKQATSSNQQHNPKTSTV